MESSLVNKRFGRVVGSNHLWYHLCRRDYGEFYENLKKDTFCDTYRLCYDLGKLNRKLLMYRKIDELYESNVFTKVLTNITDIPTEIGQLVNLQKIYMYCNQITTIPREIGRLVNLQNLDLYDNQITVIPSEMGQLVNLQELYLNDNQITTIPSEIGQLVNLQRLDLVNNQIIMIPDELKGMPIKI